MSKLVLHIPGGGMRSIPLDQDRITIGRRADNDVCLQYPAVSADHAEIVTVRGDSFLHDLGSTNGTLVNGKRVLKHFLHDRDTIDVGRVQLVYVADDDQVIAPLAADITTRNASTSVEQPVPGDEGSASAVPVPRDDADPGASDEPLETVDELLAELMESNSETAMAVEMPAIGADLSSSRASVTQANETRPDALSGVYVEVMNGPNAGQIAPMSRREFVLGQSGATKAIIRRDDDGFLLVPVDLKVRTRVNEERVPAQGARLAFGDTIDVGGVMLRFGRRPPLY